MNKNNNINKQKGGKHINSNNSSVKSKITKKGIWIAGIMTVIILISLFLISNIDSLKLGKSHSDDVQIYFYYSRGTRDAEKKEQYTFSNNDPIQVKVDFKNMKDGDIVSLSLLKIEEENQLPANKPIEIPFSEGDGSRFVTVSSLLKGRESGQYKAVIKMKIEDEVEDVLLAEKEFEIL